MNKVILIGRITKDPELRKTPQDVSVVQFTIAVNRNYQNKNGERQADFINCIAWRNQAENLARYIKKGGQIAIDGNIQTRTYDDPNGVRKYITEVVCDSIHFLEAKKNDQGFDSMSQLTPPTNNYQNNGNYSQNNYSQNNRYSQPASYTNNQQGSESKNVFDDIDKAFDISGDDLPF